MKTVNEVSKASGVSVRTLHYYDSKGILRPTRVTEAGYRLYDNNALCRLQTIMLFKELDFSLEEIKMILDSPTFDTDRALEDQIRLLKLKKERIDRMITFAEKMKTIGVKQMDFTAFDDKKQKEYAKQAKEKWGSTEAYREFEAKGRTDKDMKALGMEIMSFFAELGKLKDRKPDDADVQKVVGELRSFITANFYNCTVEVFSGLGQMYSAGGEMTDNINKAGGDGTAAFATKAIEFYCKTK